MPKMLKGVILTLLLLFSTLFFTACTKSYKTNSDQKKNIEVIVKMKNADFWNVVKMSAEAAGKEFDVNVRFDAPESEKDIDGQIRMVEQAIDSKADALVLAASDYERLVSVVEKAVNSKIPVIVIDSALNSHKIKSFIATDNVDAGRKVGEKLVELLGDKCKIAIINFVKGAAPADQREEGLLNILNKYPDIKIVAKEYCNSDTLLALQMTKKVISENGEIDCIVGLNAMSTVGVANAIKEMNLGGKVKVIGFDSTLEEIDLIEDNIIQATVVQNPISMGYLGIKYAVEAIKNKSIPKVIDTGSKVIDKTNMYAPENQKLLFPFVK